MIHITQKGNWSRTEKFLSSLVKTGKSFRPVFEKYAKMGVTALAAATPKEDGLTAASWGYEIEESSTGTTIYWTNTNINKGVPIAVILQYGHGTGTGGYVQGRDYINPAIQPIFDQITNELLKEVTSNG